MEAEKRSIEQLLKKGSLQQAALQHMQLLKSMCRHFVSGKHYSFFDDMYSPDYTATDITRLFKCYHAEGSLPTAVVDYLNRAWKEIKEEEACWNYGIPSEKWKP